MIEQPIQLLIVEDDADFRDSSARWMQRKGHKVSAAASGAEALSLCERQDFDVGIFDMNMPGMSGLELLERVRSDGIDMEVIILTGQGTIESAVQAMKMGANDYLTKPCPLGDLEHHCILARERGRLRRENEKLKAIISLGQRKTEIIGKSSAMSEVQRLIHRIAPTDKPVLLTGESGTGKEVVAKSIQQESQLASMPFVTVNCAALPEQLVESELFGHQKGSFTGATSEKPGLFEVADGGTLFIDELGELPLALQPKLLRVLEDGSMRRIGSHKERVVNVRIIAATNRDLGKDVKSGRFREDLYYRVNVLPIRLPPLRERREDIDPLIDHFLQVGWHIDPDARRALNSYTWPGNVRELINVVQRAVILADNEEITLDDLPREVTHDVPSDPNSSHYVPRHAASSNVAAGSRFAAPSGTYPHQAYAPPGQYPLPPASGPRAMDQPDSNATGDRLDDIAKAHVMEVLRQHHGNKAKAARVLGIHRRKLYRLLERFENQDKPDAVIATDSIADANPGTSTGTGTPIVGSTDQSEDAPPVRGSFSNQESST